MRLGLSVRNTGPSAIEAIRRLPCVAQEWGYTSVWFTDHVVGVGSFAPFYRPEWAEALACLAYAAATTSTVRLGVSVLVAPYRDPVYAAKAIATIDQLSGGRLDVGVGTGWARSEFHALGRGHLYPERGPATDEALEVMLRCWPGGELGFEGRWTSFRRIEFAPVPAQRPHPPLWVGGNGPAALRRAARFADVWHPFQLPPDELGRLGARLDVLAGRPVPRSVRLGFAPGTAPAEAAELLQGYQEAGCVEAVVEVLTDDFDAQHAFAEGLARVALQGS